MLTAKLMSSN